MADLYTDRYNGKTYTTEDLTNEIKALNTTIKMLYQQIKDKRGIIRKCLINSPNRELGMSLCDDYDNATDKMDKARNKMDEFIYFALSDINRLGNSKE